MDIYSYLELLFKVILTAIAYCSIPVILRFTLVKKRTITNKVLTRISIANSIIIKVIFWIMEYALLGDTNMSGIWYGPPILYFFLNRWILHAGNRKYHGIKKDSVVAEAEDIKYTFNDTHSTVTDTFKEKKTLDIEEDISTDCIKNNKKIKDIIHTENKSSSKKIIVTLSCICALLLISTISVSVFAYSLFCEKEEYISVSENTKTDAYNRGYSAGHNDGYEDCLKSLEEMGVINY